MNCPVFLFSKLSCSLNSFVFSVICFPFQSAVDGHKNVVGGRHADGEPGVETAGERHTVATHRHDRHSDLKGRVDVIKLSYRLLYVAFYTLNEDVDCLEKIINNDCSHGSFNILM